MRDCLGVLARFGDAARWPLCDLLVCSWATHSQFVQESKPQEGTGLTYSA